MSLSLHFISGTESEQGSERDDDRGSGNEDEDRNSEPGADNSEPEHEFDDSDAAGFCLFVVESTRFIICNSRNR